MTYLSRLVSAMTFVLVFASMALGLDGLSTMTASEHMILSGNHLNYLP